MAGSKRREASAALPGPRSARRRLRALLWLSGSGAALSTWLIWIHLRLLVAPGAGSACNLGDYFDCDAVNTSSHAEILGVPIAYGGAVFYALLGGLAAAEYFRGAKPRALAYARGLGAAAVLYSTFLALVSALIVEAFCLFCAGLYLVNAGIAWVGWYRPPARPAFWETLRADLRLLLTGLSAWKAQAALAVAIVGAVVLAQLGAELRAAGAAELVAGIDSRYVSAAPGHSDGWAGARLVVIEFSDFECPYCASASATLNKLRREVGDSVRFVFKHFPLDPTCNRHTPRGPHDRACAAAVGAVCAGEQGRFWEYHDRIFERGASASVMRRAAEDFGLDVPVWKRCLSSVRARSAVVNDIEAGLEAGVRSTPTFLIGRRVVRGARPYDQMLRIVRSELRAAEKRGRGS